MWREDAASSDWGTASNWEDGLVPGTSTHVQIAPGNQQPIINSSVGCNNLNILADATLTINSGKTLTVEGDLIIESNTDGDGYLIDNGNLIVSGSSSIHRKLTHYGSGNNEYHFLSIPIANHAVENSLNNCYVYPYDETTNSWISLSTGENLVKGKGYSVYYSGDADFTAIFGGMPNTGDQTISVTASDYSGNSSNDNWNLVGNPFPSAIDWDEVGKTNIESAIYIWRPSSLTYASYVNGVGSNINDDGIVPAMQAFFVHATSNGSFIIPQSSRTGSHTQDYLKNYNNEEPVLKISASKNKLKDETIIRQKEGANPTFDEQFDAYKFFSENDSIVQIYTRDVNNQKLSINTIPAMGSAISIPLELIQSMADSIHISFVGIKSFGLTMIRLEDKIPDQIIEINKDTVLSLYCLPSEENRFILHFIPQFNLIKQLIDDEIKIWNSEDKIQLWIGKLNRHIVRVRLYDLCGRLLLNDEFKGTNTIQIQKPRESGIYILQLMMKTKTYNTKIYVKN